ncbi:hypothetical protein EJB05_33331, partial [Eragrostis curvula]
MAGLASGSEGSDFAVDRAALGRRRASSAVVPPLPLIILPALPRFLNTTVHTVKPNNSTRSLRVEPDSNSRLMWLRPASFMNMSRVHSRPYHEGPTLYLIQKAMGQPNRKRKVISADEIHVGPPDFGRRILETVYPVFNKNSDILSWSSDKHAWRGAGPGEEKEKAGRPGWGNIRKKKICQERFWPTTNE